MAVKRDGLAQRENPKKTREERYIERLATRPICAVNHSPFKSTSHRI